MMRDERDRLRPGVAGQLSQPSDVVTWFVFDLLAIVLVGVGIYAGLFAFARATPPSPTPLDLFAGNAVLLIIGMSVLAITLTMIMVHVRQMVAQSGDFRLRAIVGIILVSVMIVTIGFTMFRFRTSPAAFTGRLAVHLVVQGLLLVISIYYAAELKSELMRRLYNGLYGSTIRVGIARLRHLNRAGESSDRDLSWLDNLRRSRAAELEEFDRLYRTHRDHLVAAGGGGQGPGSGGPDGPNAG